MKKLTTIYFIIVFLVMSIFAITPREISAKSPKYDIGEIVCVDGEGYIENDPSYTLYPVTGLQIVRGFLWDDFHKGWWYKFLVPINGQPTSVLVYEWNVFDQEFCHPNSPNLPKNPPVFKPGDLVSARGLAFNGQEWIFIDWKKAVVLSYEMGYYLISNTEDGSQVWCEGSILTPLS